MAGGAELLALLPKGLSKGEGPMEDEDSSDEDAGTMAARDFYEAGAKKDWAAASEALETFCLGVCSKYMKDM